MTSSNNIDENDDTSPVGLETAAASLDTDTIIMNDMIQETEDTMINATEISTTTSTSSTIDDDINFIKDLLHSLPPMTQNELETIVNNIQQFVVVVPSSSTNDATMNEKLWKDHIIEPFWNEYNTRTCRRNNNTNNISSDTKSSSSSSTLIHVHPEHITHLQKQIQDYQSTQYNDKENVIAKFQLIEEEDEVSFVNDTDIGTTQSILPSKKCIVLRTFVEYIDASNYRTGSWQGYWSIRIADDITATIHGSIQIHTYYTENNHNSQIRTKEIFPIHTISLQQEKVNNLVAQFEKTKLSYAEKLITKIVQYIIQKEYEYYINIDEYFNNNNTSDNNNNNIEQQLKSMRRILPITKTKFQWSTSNTIQKKNMIQLQFMHQTNNSKKK